MTDIEELVRASLRGAPSVTPSTSDPVGVVTGRVRRARLRWGGGIAAMVAVLVAAVVVPLSLRDSAAGRLVPSGPPPSSAPPSSSRLTPWGEPGAVAVTAGGGWLWELDWSGHVSKIDPRTHEAVQKWDVETGAEGLAYGGDVVWLWTVSTHSDVVALGGLVQAVDVSGGGRAASYPVTGDALDDLTVLSQPSGRGDALIAVGKTLRQLRLNAGRIAVVATMALPPIGAGRVAATGSGDYWMSVGGGQLWELSVSIAPDGSRLVGPAPRDKVPFDGGVIAPAGPDSIWTDEGGRLVALSPALLHQGESVAQGDRIAVPGDPVAVVADGEGGLFISIAPPAYGPPNNDRPGLYHLTKAMIDDGDDVTSTTPWLPDESPSVLAPDGHGGVDFVNSHGWAEHWQP